jgi:hypothetical protein
VVVWSQVSLYKDAVKRLQTVRLIAPTYFTIVGIKAQEAAVVTRSRWGEAAPLQQISSTISKLVQTNIDCGTQMAFEVQCHLKEK